MAKDEFAPPTYPLLIVEKGHYDLLFVFLLISHERTKGRLSGCHASIQAYVKASFVYLNELLFLLGTPQDRWTLINKKSPFLCEWRICMCRVSVSRDP